MPSILLVEDSASMRQLACFTLKQAGFAVTEAVDGADGIEQAKQQPFDLILTDVNMPNKDGFALVAELREVPEYASTPFIILTTESSMNMKELGEDCGVTDWIVKPFQPDALLKTIKNYV